MRLDDTVIPISTEDNSSTAIETIKQRLEQLQREAEAAQGKVNDTQKALDGMNAGGADKAVEGVSRLQTVLEKVKSLSEGATNANAALGLSKIGSESAAAFIEADRLGGELQSLAKGAGFEGQIDKIKDLGATIAGLKGGDDDAIATSIGSAIAKGRLQGLAGYGIVLSETAKEKIKAAGAISEEAKAQETANQVLLAGAAAMETIRASTSPATAAIGEFENRLGNLQEQAGSGSAGVKALVIDGILSPLLSLPEATPGLVAVAGGAAEIGGEFLEAGEKVGDTVDKIKGIGETYNTIKNAVLGARTALLAKLGITTADTAATVTNTGATVAGGAAAGAASVGHDALAVSEGAAAVAADAEAGSVTVAGGASAASGAAAAAGAVGFGALAAGIWAASAPLLVFVGIALAAAAAMKGLDYWLHKSEDEQLQKNIDAGNATNQKRLDDANAQRAKHGLKAITVEEWQKMESDDESVITPEAAAAAKAKPKWNSGGDGSGAPTDSAAMPDLNALKAELAAAQPTGGTSSALPSGYSTSSGGIIASSSALPPSSGAGGGSDTDPYADQIRALTRQKRDLKGKENAAKRDDLQKQIDAAQDAQRAWKSNHSSQVKAAHEAEAASKKEEAEAKRQGAAMVKGREAGERLDLSVEKNRRENALEDATDALSDELEKAKKEKNTAQVRALTTRIEMLKARAKFEDAMAAAAVEDDAKKRAALETIAREDFDHDQRKALRAGFKATSDGGKSDDVKAHDALVRAQILKQMANGGFGGSGGFLPGGLRNGDGFRSASIPMPPSFYPMDPGGMQPNGGAPSDTTFKNYDMRQVGDKVKFTSELEIDLKDLRQGMGVNQRGRHRRG